MELKTDEQIYTTALRHLKDLNLIIDIGRFFVVKRSRCMFFSKKPKKFEQIDIGKQSCKIWYRDHDSTHCKELTLVGIYTRYHSDSFLIKKASVESFFERAYEKGFFAFDGESDTTYVIPVNCLLKVVISPLEENWITPE